MTRSSEFIHLGLLPRAVRAAIAWGAPTSVEDGLDEAIDALSVAEDGKEISAIKALIDTHLSISVNDALRAWECATTAGEKRDARRDLVKTREWANEIARDAGISPRSRMVR